MHQLVYISTMRKRIEEAELNAILETSIRNNARADVTGVLLVGGNRFLQALEGPSAAVLQTYDRIRRDDRHFAWVTISSGTIEERAFGDWAMACERSSQTGNRSLPAIVEQLTRGFSDLNLQAQLRGFAELHAS